MTHWFWMSELILVLLVLYDLWCWLIVRPGLGSPSKRKPACCVSEREKKNYKNSFKTGIRPP